jgi:hypothetical protein
MVAWQRPLEKAHTLRPGNSSPLELNEENEKLRIQSGHTNLEMEKQQSPHWGAKSIHFRLAIPVPNTETLTRLSVGRIKRMLKVCEIRGLNANQMGVQPLIR